MNAKPANLKAILWFIFSGTATLSAFILPIHIWASFRGYHMQTYDYWFPRGYLFILLVSALYHGLYRTQTILADLGVPHAALRITGLFLSAVFLLACVAVALALFPLFFFGSF